MSSKLILVFNVERTTKRTTLFLEDKGPKESATVGRLYIKNSALKLIDNPKKIQVAITPVE